MDKLLSDLAQFHFLRPEWFLALIPAVILIVLLWNKRSAAGTWQAVISPHLLPHLLQGNIAKPMRVPFILLLIGWVLAVFAMAGPTWKKLPQAVQKKVDAQVIVMDLSLSMFAQDISPSRLTRAKHKLSDILNKTKEGLTGLVVFAGTPHVVTPLTDDTRTILSMVDSLSPDIMPIAGSDPASAVIRAQKVLKQGGMRQGHIILLTDDIPADFVEKVKKEVDVNNTPVSIFAIGTTEGAPIALPDGNFVKDDNGAIVIPKVNESLMKTAAKQLRGRFTTLTYSDEDVDYLLEYKASLLDHETKETERDFDTWDDAGHWIVLLILPLAAIGYRKGWLGALLLPMVFVSALGTPQTANASIWDDLWKTPDQQGQQAWRQEQYNEAANKFKDPMWKGSAYYRAKDFENAAKEFSKLDTPDSNYNLGNALAKQQLIDEAISAYEKALEQDPSMEDAKKNLELLKQLKEQQQKQQGDDKNKDDKNSEQQDSEKQNQQQQEENPKNPHDSKEEQGSEQPSQNAEEESQQQAKPEDSQNQEEEKQQQAQANQNEQEQEEPNEQQQPQPIRPEFKESQQSAEDQQALQQWLERVPDEPGGLLRRKFKLESQLRNRSNLESQAW